MQGEGFEPSNSERTVLQTARFDRLHIPAKDSQGTYVGRDPSFLMIQEVNFLHVCAYSQGAGSQYGYCCRRSWTPGLEA